MSDLAKFRKVLNLVASLRSPLGCNKKQFAQAHEISERTVERYFKLLSEVGFTVERVKKSNRFKIEMPDKMPVHFEDHLIFSIEEAGVIKEALAGTEKNNPFVKSIFDKILSISPLEAVGYTFQALNFSDHIKQLNKAIENKKQVVLKNYESNSSKTRIDRLIEPIQISGGFQYLTAYEIESNTCKSFRIERIEKVVPINKKWMFESQHQLSESDIFGMTGTQATNIKLKMGQRAYRLLIEEYPQSKNYIKKVNNEWLFETKVYDIKGVGRFVSGFLDEIKVIEPQQLIDYLAQNIQNFKSRHGLS